jgi:hypothetical protein
MKPIKIIRENTDLIEAALADVNGRASAHAFTYFLEIEYIRDKLTEQLDRLHLPQALRAGAFMISMSGNDVPNKYKGTRVGTCVKVEHRSKDVYLTEISRVTLWQQGGKDQLFLLPKQEDWILQNIRKQWTTVKEAT